MEYELRDKVVLVTGGAGGIGAGVVENLLQEKVKHVAFIDIAETVGKIFQDGLQKKYGSGKAKFHKCDVTKDDQLFDAFKSVQDENGAIDLVINNAGIMNDSWDMYKKEIEINFVATVTSTYKALELMRKDEGGKGGTIINISSVAALGSTPTVPVYHATKSAVLQFGICLSYPEYHAITGVRILTVCFGLTDTEILNKYDCYDKVLTQNLVNVVNVQYKQKISSAVSGAIEVYKKGENGTIWLVNDDRPAKNITDDINKGYAIFGEAMKNDLFKK